MGETIQHLEDQVIVKIKSCLMLRLSAGIATFGCNENH